MSSPEELVLGEQMEEAKQQISVPFCWEDVPGRPKTGWGVNDFFKWERKARVDLTVSRRSNPFLDSDEEGSLELTAGSSELTDFSGEWEAGGDETVLEFLFQMSSPEVSFFHENCRHEGNAAASKRPPTLEELIFLSRQLSRARRAETPQYPSRSTKTRVHICGLFRTRVNAGSLKI